MTKHGKNFRTATALIEHTKAYTPAEAIDLVKKVASAKFDETVELSVALGIDPKQTSQAVRGTVNLPHGSGRKVVVVVFTDKPDEVVEADHVGLEDLVAKVKEGWCDFDVAIATPEAMKQVRSVARV